MAEKYSPETICVHGAYDPKEHNRSRAVPLYQSSAFTYDSSDHAAGLPLREDLAYPEQRHGSVDWPMAETSRTAGGAGYP